MKGTRFYKAIIAVLILINVASLTFMWFGKPPHPPMPHERPLLSNVIGLKGDAKTRVDALESKHHEEKQRLIAIDRDLHHQLFDSIGNDSAPRAVQDKLDANKSKMDRMTFDFFNEVAKQCNESEKKKLKSFISGELRQITGDRPRPNHPNE
jgi:hypothetical protein